MDCLLLRHGIATNREEWMGKDADRPLTDKGKRKVRQVVVGLRLLDLEPTHVFVSPLVRAVETAKILQAVWPLPHNLQIVDALLPEAAPELLLRLLGDMPRNACVICVGHEPHLGRSAGFMLCGKPAEAFALKKAGACLIELPTVPQAGRGRLRWWLPPAQLRALGKQRQKSKKEKARPL